jgi:hypothetical protein
MWVLSGQKIGNAPSKTMTCPTCRAPFSRVLTALLDDQLFMRLTISKMNTIEASGVVWKFATIGMLNDLFETVQYILKHHGDFIKHIQDPNMRFTFTTLAEKRLWTMPKCKDVLFALVAFVDEVKNRIGKYKYCMEKSKVHQKIARRRLGNGKVA